MSNISDSKIASTLTVTTIVTSWFVKTIINDFLKLMMKSSIIGPQMVLSFALGWGGLLISSIGTVLGVFCSKWYFSKKKYVIENRNKVLRLAVIYFAAVMFVLTLLSNILLIQVLGVGIDILSIVIGVLIGSIVFYLSGVMIIKNTDLSLNNPVIPNGG